VNITAPRLLVLPVAVALALSMTGCSAVANIAQKTHDESFADRAAATTGWTGVPAPSWLPSDATDIHNLATNDETNAVIALKSTSREPSGCVEADREAIPFDQPSWAPKLDRFPDRVQRCGDYEVMRIDGGLLGWFSASEPGQKPTASAS
jgi:hypothetical protein